ncbi:circadian clock protein KaiC [Thiohalomonas denitrificans]|uniref:non-specific serine/threonine protein kinase n=1 Tax=Thiohalomonas denitrificans TaxID=415747 RepID=A0A1G5QME3_9GAMM|nr:circadian clock protein KaiC [Thiohalomonas denitrificans]SCZ62892.1 circadian clock protein KaiC [Thiohalomonas denitrificans]
MGFARTELPKISTGIDGLDAILGGGIPEGRTTLVHGGTGSGKTMVGLQWLHSGALAGEAGLFLSLEESAESLRRNTAALGWDLEREEREGRLALVDAKPEPSAIAAGDFSLTGFLALIEGQARRLGARRVVIDAIDMLLYLFNDPVRERNEMLQLHEWLTEQRFTAVLTAKRIGETLQYPYLEFLTDCVIQLEASPESRGGRELQVIKYRGSGFSAGTHRYTISDEGVALYPLVNTELGYRTVGSPVATGLPDLDQILGGGVRQGSCALISGASGTGKSTFASTYAQSACERGEGVLYLNFEESANNFIALMRSTGLYLQPVVDTGLLRIFAQAPEAAGTEEHLHRAIKLLKSFEPRHLIIDAISACKRMGSESAAFSYLLRLLTYCRERGITALLTNQVAGIHETHEMGGIGFSSLIDTIVYLDYVHIGGEVNRTLLVAKSRGSPHSNQYREFVISDRGIRFMPVYTGRGGMLTGVARQEQELREQFDQRKRDHEIEAKRREVRHRRAIFDAEKTATELQIDKADMELQALESDQQIAREAERKRQAMRLSEGEKRADDPSQDSKDGATD